jgi:hypothetical protein
MTRRHFPVMMLLLAACALAATPALATTPEKVAETSWATETPLSGTVVGSTVVLDASQGGVYPLTVMEAPPLGGGDIVLTVDVAVDEVGSPGYLELWAVFDDGGRFFSRSFDNAGVGVLRSGVSATVQLPFSLSGTVPDALELNAVLPDGGRLEIGAVALYEVTPGGALFVEDDDDGAWWSDRTSGLFGGIAGGAVGVLGALLGGLASRGRARRFVLRSLVGGAIVGAVAVAAGIVAVVTGQPYAVWFPLLLFGVILGAVFGGLIPSVSARYEAMELQKMRAHDLV